MRTLYFECNMGAAGDMLMASLLELHDHPEDFLRRLNAAGIPGVVVTAESSVKCGISGTHISVKIDGREEDEEHEHHEHSHHRHAHEEYEQHEHSHGMHEHHHHNSYHDIEHIIGHLNISDVVKKDAAAVYKLIAEAESHVHCVPVDKIHFHEVGELDAVADIVGVCMLMEELAPDIVLASPIHVGSGQVRCAHGVLPVPAPATSYILKGIPIYSGQTSGELCTPTGAALLKYFVKDFYEMPVITVEKLGYGMGKKDFEQANCLRAYIGETNRVTEEVIELVCNLDDMTPEAITFAQELLLEEGALDVYTAPIGMKKGRTGFRFTCMCDTKDKEKMLSLIFKHTTTIGIREYTSRRYTLHREQIGVQTEFGVVNVKTSHGFGVKKSKPEYEDIAEIARKENKSIQEVCLTVNAFSLETSYKI